MMRVYVGQTRDRKLVARLAAAGIGECCQRGELPPRRTPWFYDNKAFTDWQNGQSFNSVRFTRDIWSIDKWCTYGTPPRRGASGLGAPMARPDFIVLPDLVARGRESLEFSLSWYGPQRPCVSGWPAPVYLAVQDGMTPTDVEPHLEKLAGIFVGGSVDWKEQTGADWVAFAHEHGKRCHIGRAGGAERAAWALAIGADSVDSSLPLMSEENLQRFVGALGLQVPMQAASP